MPEAYELQKWVWTQDDYEQMGWHDCHIHALAFLPENFELLLDIDYIFRWLQPTPPQQYFSFWVAPATLVFENVYDVALTLRCDSGLEIDDIKRNQTMPVHTEYDESSDAGHWTIACQEGQITLRSTGYTQYIRATPQYSASQSLDMCSRGGFSFLKGRKEMD